MASIKDNFSAENISVPLNPNKWSRTFIPCILAIAACNADLPEEGRIASHRVLAIRTEVVQTLDPNIDIASDRTRAEALPFDWVELTPFIVNPLGPVELETVDPIWIACELGPERSLFSCIKEKMPLSPEMMPLCGAQDLSMIRDLSQLPAITSPCQIPNNLPPNLEGNAQYQVPLSFNLLSGGSVELTLIAHAPGGTSTTEACARTLLSGTSQLPDDCLFATQRIAIGPAPRIESYLQNLINLLSDIPPTPIPDFPIDADRNPQIASVSLTRKLATGEMFAPIVIENGASVMANPGDVFRIDVIVPESELQTYTIDVNNGQSVVEQQEKVDGQWFRSFGKLLSNVSNDPISYNEWELIPGDQDETETPPMNQSTLYHIVRDGRQGVDWFWFSIFTPQTKTK